MKDNLLEMLMAFFEKSFSRKKLTNDMNLSGGVSDEAAYSFEHSLVVKRPKDTSIRIFTECETSKFTKASYQYLTRIHLLKILPPEHLELVIHQLTFSESPIVSLEETKWAIRAVLADKLEAKEFLFLELLLQQKDEELVQN